MRYLNLILLIVVLGVTASIFFALNHGIHSDVFWFNLSFSCFLEILFFGAIIKISSQPLITLPNAAVVTQINYYIIISVALILAYNFYVYNFVNPIWYFVSITVLSLFYLVLIGFTFQGGQAQQQDADEVTNLVEKRMQKLADLNKIKFSFLNSVNGKQSLTEVVGYSKRLDLVIEKAAMLPIAKLEKKPEFVSQLNEMLFALQNEISKLNAENPTTHFLANLKQLEVLTDKIDSFITISKQTFN